MAESPPQYRKAANARKPQSASSKSSTIKSKSQAPNTNPSPKLETGDRRQKEKDLQEIEVRQRTEMDNDVFVNHLKRRAFVGTEFTFQSEDISRMKIFDSHQKNSTDKLVTLGNKKMEDWSNKIGNSSIDVNGKKIYRKKTTENKRGKGETNLILFNYNWDGGSWWWKLSLDDACIETQTQPTTYENLENKYKDDNGSIIANIIEADIFGVAGKIGLNTVHGIRGGGGHITLDIGSAFSSYPEQDSTEIEKGLDEVDVDLFLRLFVYFQKNAEEWKSELSDDDDKLNASWITEQDVHKGKGTLKLLDDLEKSIAIKSIDLCTSEINGLYEKLEKKSIFSEYDSPKETVSNLNKNKKHYQAINVENPGRIEFRRISAQNNLQELLSQLDYIFAKMAIIREKLTEEQRSRKEKKED